MSTTDSVWLTGTITLTNRELRIDAVLHNGRLDDVLVFNHLQHDGHAIKAKAYRAEADALDDDVEYLWVLLGDQFPRMRRPTDDQTAADAPFVTRVRPGETLPVRLSFDTPVREYHRIYNWNVYQRMEVDGVVLAVQWTPEAGTQLEPAPKLPNAFRIVPPSRVIDRRFAVLKEDPLRASFFTQSEGLCTTPCHTDLFLPHTPDDDPL